MTGGAVVAAAAAYAKRRQAILDAFRVADATAPERARSLRNLGLERTSELEEYVKQGIVVESKQDGLWQ